MKIKTDFGIQEIKPQKVFTWEKDGITFKFAIVKRPENYMGSYSTAVQIQRVVEYSTSISLPISLSRGDTLKTIQQKAITSLNSREVSGQEFKQRIEMQEIINFS